MHADYPPELIQAAYEGDTEAIEQLLLEYQPSLTRFARKFCATPEDVEDAVQETLWAIYRKISTLRASAAFISWTFQIVRNHCYLLLKAPNLSTFDLSKLDYLDYMHGTDAELYAALKQDVSTAIAQLPPAYRQVLAMRDMEGLSGPQVAESLGLSLETVKSRLHRARQILREKLAHWNS